MMAADYRHIGGVENRLGRHYSRFSPFSPTPALAGQSLALRKLRDAGSNRRSRAKNARLIRPIVSTVTIPATLPRYNQREHSMIPGVGPYSALITPIAGSLFHAVFQARRPEHESLAMKFRRRA